MYVLFLVDVYVQYGYPVLVGMIYNALLQSVAIFDVLDNLLEDVNRQSFVMLEETGGSERVLLNVERYALYVADVLQAGGETLSRNRTGDNIGVCVCACMC